MSSTRKRGETLPPAHSNVGPVWFVSSDHADHHVAAGDALEAAELYYSIPTVASARIANPKDTEIRKIEVVSMTVYARPGSRPGKTDGQ